MNRFPFLTPLAFSLLLLGAGCSTTPPEPSPVPETTTRAPSPTESSSASSTSENLPNVDATYEPFIQSRYDAALADHRPVLLFFYAEWCPYCQRQDPVMEKVFQDKTLGVRAFRVHVLDSSVTPEERKLSDGLRISQQHTFVLLDKDGKEAGRRIGTMDEEGVKKFLEKVR